MRIATLIVLALLLRDFGSRVCAADGRLGRNELEIGEALGSSSEATALFPADRAQRYEFLESSHCEVGFVDDRAAYFVVEGTRLTMQQVSEIARRVSPSVTLDLDEWYLDRDQTKMYPPLNRQALRTLFVPTGVEHRFRQHDWSAVRKYFDGYGNQIGQQELGRFSTVAPEAHLTGIYRTYVARRGVVRMTMVRADRKVYATFDLTFDSEAKFPLTSSLLIAEAETYWQLVLSQVQRAVTSPARPEFPDSGEIHYEEALASLLPPLVLREVLVQRYLAAYVAAVDSGEVSHEVLRRAALGVSELALGRAISHDLLGKDNLIQQRRVRLIGEMRWTFAVERLIKLLDDETEVATQLAVQDALQNVAIDFPQHPAPMAKAAPMVWQRWWSKARQDRTR